MAEETTNPAQTQAVPNPAPPAPSRQGSPLLVFLTVLLILVGIADAILWGVVGYYLIRGAQSGNGGAPVQSAAIGAAADSGGASGDTEKQEALLAYFEDISEILTLDNEMSESFNRVAGTNFTDDATMYAEINERTLPLCQQINEKVVQIVPSDQEISKLHEMVRDYATNKLNALAMLTEALENQDTAQAVEANNLVNAATDAASGFQQELLRLAEERGVQLDI